MRWRDYVRRYKLWRAFYRFDGITAKARRIRTEADAKALKVFNEDWDLRHGEPGDIRSKHEDARKSSAQVYWCATDEAWFAYCDAVSEATTPKQEDWRTHYQGLRDFVAQAEKDDRDPITGAKNEE